MTITFDGCSRATQPPDRLTQAGQLALAEAVRLWHADIIDPSVADLTDPDRPGHERAIRSREHIDRMLKAAGWGGHAPYAGNRRGPEWCGIFAAACWRVAGIKPELLATWFASTYRLFAWAHYRSFNSKANPKPPSGPYRVAVKLTGLRADQVNTRAGDVLVVGDGSPEYGDHITIVKSYADGVFATISGNGGGVGPDGKHREGVVARDFQLTGTGYRALWLYRPAVGDLA